ncbi:hypothetical protein DW673_13045 [Lactiplantibacillus plantarum]|uniref:YopX family protein n=1 Tax=Lactiplantibacillus plantarum TaxID=1590 RepID=UPI0009330255|nr:YopX family protein [Lactiplantibacillus plantarum]MBS0939344.1 hypothetical protein [Lactiplantibacillus plantarum]RHF52570.1 hypothetical protein DW673_13045 [Lactiplantibacillus plantarum]RWZ44578.1 hypothetical protein EQG58_08515 [Lactiplantibacillus plantarum]WAU29744.1 hypothetical protein OR568_01340 [Lactiplantibacillus plantarum]
MIKFRAWDKVQNKMLLPDNIELIQGQAYWAEASTGDNGSYSNDGEVDGIDALFKLEQFTGMTDMHGKEIYENDILHFGSMWCVGDEYDPREEEHIGLVEYRPDYASYVVNCNERIYPLDEVISFDGYSVHGNTHDNPELLKG